MKFRSLYALLSFLASRGVDEGEAMEMTCGAVRAEMRRTGR